MSDKVPMRLCASCRQSKDKKELIRVALLPGNQIVLDEQNKAGGRGAYICRNAECIRQGARKKALEKSFRLFSGKNSNLNESLAADIYELLMREVNNE